MNKKKRIVFFSFLLCLCLIISYIYKSDSFSSFDKRAVWLSYLDLKEFNYKDEKQFRKDYHNVLKTIKKYQTNTMIVQVHSFSDALYQSSLFPVSSYITNLTQLSFDPLEIMIELTHKENIRFEAWFNPYRISLNEKTFLQFQKYSPKKKWLTNSNTIQYEQHKYILNPASQKVRNYIVDGVKEVVENYDVDGIHFDDYFYIEGTHAKTTKNERLDYVNMLIQDVYQSIKRIRSDVVFGISTSGNYENCINEGADVNTWLANEGYIDYLMPQLYWSNAYGKYGNEELFSERAKLFNGLKKNNKVKLCGGLALYKSGKKYKEDQGWSQSHQNIVLQMEILNKYHYQAYSLFQYSSLLEEDGIKEMNEVIKKYGGNQ